MSKACPHCRTLVDVDAASCSGCGADLAPIEPSSSLPRLEARALVLWAVLVVPGLGLAVGGVVAGVPVLVVVGVVMVVVPLLVQVFGGSWGDVGDH